MNSANTTFRPASLPAIALSKITILRIGKESFFRFTISLFQIDDSPVVALNRAVAASQVHGPAAGIQAVERIENGSQLKSVLLSVCGAGGVRNTSWTIFRPPTMDHFRKALELTELTSEQLFISKRLRILRNVVCEVSHEWIRRHLFVAHFFGLRRQSEAATALFLTWCVTLRCAKMITRCLRTLEESGVERAPLSAALQKDSLLDAKPACGHGLDG